VKFDFKKSSEVKCATHARRHFTQSGFTMRSITSRATAHLTQKEPICQKQIGSFCGGAGGI
jgi:hypothetical protein